MPCEKGLLMQALFAYVARDSLYALGYSLNCSA